MRRRVEKKQKNILEMGDDSKAFRNYKKNNMSGVEELGAESVDSKGNEKKNETTYKIHEDCPYDAVQVDVYDIQNGGRNMKKSEFYTIK